MKTGSVRLPFATGGLVLLCVAIHSSEGLKSFMIYDRAAILSGELWRLITGHIAHLSWSHLAWNCAVLLFAGFIIEYRRYPGYMVLCIVSALTISAYLAAFQKTLVYYAGFSGVATALVVYLCLNEILRDSCNSEIWITTLFLILGKIILEYARHEPLFASYNQESVIMVPESHLIGVITGGLYFLWTKSISQFRIFIYEA
jgi:rhomboid family GlyGly-CTERM serine protease